MTSIFKYNEIEVPEDCIHRISPSQISKFFEYPKLYFTENIEGAKPQFQGNTATTMGTICHYIFHCVMSGLPINREIINEQLDVFNAERPELGLDLDDIKTNYPLVAEVVVNEFILKEKPKATLIKTELPVLTQIGKTGVYLGGTTDLLLGDTVCDYKTVTTKPNENQIQFGYRIQLLAYAYCLRKLGYEVNRIRLIYGVKPTKTLPARCFVVTEQIDDIQEKLIKDTIQLITDSVLICKDKPELSYLIFKSMELKH